MKYIPIIIIFIFLLVVSALGQQGAGGKITAEVIAASSTSVVKGAPFSAEAVSENVQVLADGNKISRSYTTKMFRDSEGRFRREGGSGGSGSNFYYNTGGTGFSSVGFQNSISIFDPVANVRYILQPSDKTARKMNTFPGTAESPVIVNGQSYSYAIRATVESNAAKRAEATAQAEATGIGKTSVVVLPGFVPTQNNGNSKTESLGSRSFEGVEAEGTRTVTTLPAGSIGNERDIEIIYERWFSKDLDLIVYSRHSDPRFGEQTYRLINISRSEPDRSLFVPPSDYKIISEQTYRVVTPRPAYTVKPKQ